jgi:hypothetical protein
MSSPEIVLSWLETLESEEVVEAQLTRRSGISITKTIFFIIFLPHGI